MVHFISNLTSAKTASNKSKKSSETHQPYFFQHSVSDSQIYGYTQVFNFHGIEKFETFTRKLRIQFDKVVKRIKLFSLSLCLSSTFL